MCLSRAAQGSFCFRHSVFRQMQPTLQEQSRKCRFCAVGPGRSGPLFRVRRIARAISLPAGRVRQVAAFSPHERIPGAGAGRHLLRRRALYRMAEMGNWRRGGANPHFSCFGQMCIVGIGLRPMQTRSARVWRPTVAAATRSGDRRYDAFPRRRLGRCERCGLTRCSRSKCL